MRVTGRAPNRERGLRHDASATGRRPVDGWSTTGRRPAPRRPVPRPRGRRRLARPRALPALDAAVAAWLAEPNDELVMLLAERSATRASAAPAGWRRWRRARARARPPAGAAASRRPGAARRLTGERPGGRPMVDAGALWYKQRRERPRRHVPACSAAHGVRAPAGSAALRRRRPRQGHHVASPWASSATDGELRVLETRAERHLGDPLRPFLELYRELDAGAAGRRRRDRRLRRSPRRAGPRRPARGDRPGAPPPPGCTRTDRSTSSASAAAATRCSPATPRAASRYEANERCSAGTGETVEGLCARLGRSARRGRGAGGGQPGRRHRHQPLRRVRQERAHPLRQPGRAARAHLPRPLRRASPATSTACTTRARSTAPWCSSATGP